MMQLLGGDMMSTSTRMPASQPHQVSFRLRKHNVTAAQHSMLMHM